MLEWKLGIKRGPALKEGQSLAQPIKNNETTSPLSRGAGFQHNFSAYRLLSCRELGVSGVKLKLTHFKRKAVSFRSSVDTDDYSRGKFLITDGIWCQVSWVCSTIFCWQNVTLGCLDRGPGEGSWLPSKRAWWGWLTWKERGPMPSFEDLWYLVHTI